MPVFIADDLHRIVEQLKDNAFLLRMMDLLGAGGQLLHGAAVNDVNGVRAHTFGAAGRVHRHIAAADNGDRLRFCNRRVVPFTICFHQIDACQILIG